MIKQSLDLEEFIHRYKTDMEELKNYLRNIKVMPRPEFLTTDEWMAETKMGRWKMEMLIKDGLLHSKKIGRKIYIPESEIQRFFNGEMVIK